MEPGVEHNSLMQAKKENLQMKTGDFPLDSFWKQSYKGYPNVGYDVHSELALSSSHGFDID